MIASQGQCVGAPFQTFKEQLAIMQLVRVLVWNSVAWTRHQPRWLVNPQMEHLFLKRFISTVLWDGLIAMVSAGSGRG